MKNRLGISSDERYQDEKRHSRDEKRHSRDEKRRSRDKKRRSRDEKHRSRQNFCLPNEQSVSNLLYEQRQVSVSVPFLLYLQCLCLWDLVFSCDRG